MVLSISTHPSWPFSSRSPAPECRASLSFEPGTEELWRDRRLYCLSWRLRRRGLGFAVGDQHRGRGTGEFIFFVTDRVPAVCERIAVDVKAMIQGRSKDYNDVRGFLLAPGSWGFMKSRPLFVLEDRLMCEGACCIKSRIELPGSDG